MILFFGDSITEGSNCDCSYVDFIPLENNVLNMGISGTTIGEYSIYPVDGNSLLSQIKRHADIITRADAIYLEYGCNDVTAVMCGFTSVETVLISLVKAIDWIKQLNNKAPIIFLALGNDSVILENSKNMCMYLENEYFKAFNFKFSHKIYFDTYKGFIDNVKKICDNVKYMFSEDMSENLSDYISSDNLHPNREGHKRIAKNIMSQRI